MYCQLGIRCQDREWLCTYIHRHPSYPAVPFMCWMAYARMPEKAPARVAALKKSATLVCSSNLCEQNEHPAFISPSANCSNSLHTNS